jgi:trans-aconitate methyltransferase
MSPDVRAEIDWAHWLRRWDAQQEGYVPDREARFSVMLDVLDALMPESFVALDLGCGPGSISQRLLARFPAARAIAVDIDPVMVAIGRGAVGTVGGRLRWVETDLSSPNWAAALREVEVDAVLSSTALHWLWPQSLAALYRDLGRMLGPGGLLLNGDHMAFDQTLPTFERLTDRLVSERWTDDSFATRGIETAEQWWDALAAEAAFAPLLADRAARFAGMRRQDSPPGFNAHVTALRDAGFAEVGTIWQVLSDRVLLAVR